MHLTALALWFCFDRFIHDHNTKTKLSKLVKSSYFTSEGLKISFWHSGRIDSVILNIMSISNPCGWDFALCNVQRFDHLHSVIPLCQANTGQLGLGRWQKQQGTSCNGLGCHSGLSHECVLKSDMTMVFQMSERSQTLCYTLCEPLWLRSHCRDTGQRLLRINPGL